jgi:four helix bundle protein
MTKKIDITERTFEFAVRVVTLCKALRKAGVFPEMVSQLVKAGTSAGANVAEFQAGESQPDFVHKLTIACKESKETLYGLRLIERTEETFNSRLNELIQENDEITSYIGFDHRSQQTSGGASK